MRILYFFRLNPAEKNSGSQARALSLLQYFKERNIQVDFISDHKWGNWNDETEQLFKNMRLAENLFYFKKKPEKNNLLKYFFSYKIPHFFYKVTHNYGKNSFPNHATLRVRKQFFRILQQHQYDYIIISYAYWAHLIKNNPYLGNAITIVDTHDMLAAQHQNDKRIKKGKLIYDELRRLNLFDQVWAISQEETYFFSQFLKNKVRYIPIMVDEPAATNESEKNFDIIYVATDNPHNLPSAKWFFDNVYSLLSPTIKICVVGSITSYIPQKLSNVSYINFVDDLNTLYAKSKIAVCPMLTGTGIKVKVVEALANGLPVVCNERGLDGLPNKTNNGCLVTNDVAIFAKYIQQLLTDDDLYNQQRMLGKKIFKENFTKQSVYKKLDDALEITSSI